MRRPPLTQAELLHRLCANVLVHHRRRARAEGKTVPYRAYDLEVLAGRSPACSYCGLPVGLDLHFDHETPPGRGGDWTLDNLRIACGRCNRLKGRLTLVEFLTLRDFLKQMHPVAYEDVCRRLLAGGKSAYGGRKGGRT